MKAASGLICAPATARATAYIKKPRLERRRKFARRRRAPQKTAASRQCPDLQPLSKRRGRAARRPGFAVERAAAFRRPSHRHTECLYRPALQFFQRGNPASWARWRNCPAIAIEKARLYERIVDVEEQLRQNEKLSALGLLAAEVAHEIRNPLTVMKLLYHSLNLKFPDGDPRAKDARLIDAKIDHLNKIVEQILDFARTTEPQARAGEFERIAG